MSLRGLTCWFAGVSLLSVASRLGVRDEDPGRCSLDGAAIEPVRRVELVAGGVERARFCSIPCALAWPEIPPAARWQVQDETSGRPLDAALACFVEGRVPSGRAGPRVRAFERSEDATRFCSQLGGTPIENPFARVPARASPR